MFVRPSMRPLKAHIFLSNCDIGLKFKSNNGNFNTQIGIKNDSNRSKVTPRAQRMHSEHTCVFKSNELDLGEKIGPANLILHCRSLSFVFFLEYFFFFLKIKTKSAKGLHCVIVGIITFLIAVIFST